MARTLLLVMLGWVVFKATDLGAALRMLGGMIGLNGVSFSPAVDYQLMPDRLAVMVIGAGLVCAMPWLKRHASGPSAYLIVPLFLWAVATLSSQSFTPFLYFQF